MHGHRRFAWSFLFTLATVAGCKDAVPSQQESPPSAPEASVAFDPDRAGTIEGQVRWSGELPVVEPCRAWVQISMDGRGERVVRENPNAPAIDPKGRGVAGAVIFLHGVDPKQARPWDHPPVRVEQRDYRLHVCQGDAEAHSGFVRRGDTIEMVSRQPIYHSLRAGGAAFFTLTFPDPDQPLTRRLDRRGVVELSSAAGYWWMRGYLFVDDHPYYARTDAEGRFVLKQVPPGRYEVVCWLPSWHKGLQERNQDTARVWRLHFRPPVVQAQTVELAPATTGSAGFTISPEAFEIERPAVAGR